ncbi:MAG: helix-turn-helix domain-containing protein, partial [Clostridia bacterium]|nr:helix-turn-helix domain-containing protein [Clostridia bacterium]
MNTTEKIIREIEEAIRTGDETYTPPSGMQIHRLFLSEVGYTPAEYLKRRRLSAALARIRASEWKDADIAYACGYSSQQAMCREIRKQIGMTAGQYRKGTDILYFPPYTGSRVCPLTVSKQNIPSLTAFHYDASTLTGLETAAVQLFLSANPEYSGRLFGRDGGQIGKRFRYTLYVTDSCTVPDGLIPGETVPAFSAVMAVTSAPDHEPLINAAWDWLYSHWLPNSGYTYAGEYTPTHETAYFEEYLLRNGHPYRLKLYLPLEKSDTFRQIRIE